MKSILSLDVGQKSHVSSALNGLFDGTLLLCRESRALAADDASMRIDELLEYIDVFIVYITNICLHMFDLVADKKLIKMGCRLG